MTTTKITQGLREITTNVLLQEVQKNIAPGFKEIFGESFTNHQGFIDPDFINHDLIAKIASQENHGFLQINFRRNKPHLGENFINGLTVEV